MYVTSADIAEHIVDLLISSAIFCIFKTKDCQFCFINGPVEPIKVAQQRDKLKVRDST